MLKKRLYKPYSFVILCQRSKPDTMVGGTTPSMNIYSNPAHVNSKSQKPDIF